MFLKKKCCMLAAVLAAVLLAGCSPGAGVTQSPYREDVSVQKLREEVADELDEDYWPNMDIPAEMLEEVYGVAPDLYEEAAAQMPMISANVDTLIIMKAKEGSEKEVEEALLSYQQYSQEDAVQYPSNIGKILASQVKTFGRYVCFVQLGGDISRLEEEAEGDGNAAVINHCEQINAKALAEIEDTLLKKDKD